MELATYALAATAIIGLLNGVTLALDKNWKGFALFCTAVIAGLVFGYLKWFMLPSAEMGLLVGLASSGAYKMVQVVGIKSNANPS